MLAAVIGLVTEAVIWFLRIEAGQKLDYDIPAWLQIAQMPGGQIAERLFSGLIPGLLCAILFQSGLFSAIALSIIYITRLIRGSRDS